MLNERRQQVLRLLLSSEDSLTAAAIGRTLGIAARSVRYDLQAVDQWIKGHGAQLVGTAGVGYRLEGPLAATRAALDQLGRTHVPVYEYVLSPRERVRRQLLHLLGEPGPVSLQALADRLGVGKSTVHADLSALDAWVTRRGLTVDRSHAGIRLTGPEGLVRQAMADLVMELADEGQLAMLMDGHPDSEPLLSLLRPMLPRVDWLAVGAAVQQAGSPELAVSLAVMVNRLAGGCTLPYSPEQVERAMKTDEWRRAQAAALAVEHCCGVRVPSTEVAALALLHATVRPDVAGNAPGALSEGDLAMARSLAGMVQARLGVPLAQDQEFVMGLAIHLRPIEHRLRRGLVVDNPLLGEIRAKYPPAYRAAEDVAGILSVEWRIAVPEAEVGYLAVHIAAAMERAKLRRPDVPRALVVCGSGIGTAQLLATRLRGAVPEVNVVRITSAFRLRELLALEPYDLVISTCQIAPCDIPVVRVSPLLAESDQSRIRQVVAALTNRTGRGRQPVLREVLTPEHVALDVEAESWEEAVRAAGSLLVNAGCVEARYVDAMIRTTREMGPYIVLGPGFALPHARPEDGVKRLGISLVRLRRPVAFGHKENDPVDLVFALGAIDNETHLKALMQLSDLLGNPVTLAALRAAPDLAAVTALVDGVSGETPAETTGRRATP